MKQAILSNFEHKFKNGRTNSIQKNIKFWTPGLTGIYNYTNYREMVNTFSCLFWFGFGSIRTILLVLDLENGPNLNAFSSALFGLVWFVFGSMCRILRVVDLAQILMISLQHFSGSLVWFGLVWFGLVWFWFYVQNSLRG